jgi:hypothetical protein
MSMSTSPQLKSIITVAVVCMKVGEGGGGMFQSVLTALCEQLPTAGETLQSYV